MIEIYDANAHLRTQLTRSDGAAPFGPRMLYGSVCNSPNPQIWVWDGSDNNELRRAIYDPYKRRDYTNMENVFAGLKLYRRLLAHSPAIQIEVPHFEADDVCATLARRYAEQGHQVRVYTNDFDFFQLTVDPRISLRGVRQRDDVPPQYVRLYKALRGDTSDKIPGMPGFGDGTWAKFKELWPVMDAALRDQDAEAFRALPFTAKPRGWVADDENFDLLCKFYQITQMFDVPTELIDKHTTAGAMNPNAAEALFQEFML